MTTTRDPIGEFDLDAYVDDQLDVARRIEVEAFLSSHPDTAARVMSDLRMRDELRLALAGTGASARPATTEAARRLERALSRRWMLRRLQQAASVILLLGAGWLAHEVAGPLSVGKVVASTPAPAYVEEAMRAHGTSVLRASMHSQPPVQDYDPNDIRAATAIVMPSLPDGWTIRDVQIYPSQYGPGVELAAEAGRLGLVSLYAVRPGTFDVVRPTVASQGEVSSAYFQIGDVAYALVANADAANLDRMAERLADSLY